MQKTKTPCSTCPDYYRERRERGCHGWVVVPNANLFTDLTHVLWYSNLHLHSFEWRCNFDSFPSLPPSLLPSLKQFRRHGCQNRILARFRPPHTPSAEHAPTPAHPRTPAHLLDINNPGHILEKKITRPLFFVHREISFIYIHKLWICMYTYMNNVCFLNNKVRNEYVCIHT